MQGLNSVMLLGSLGAKPELRYTQSGTPVLSLSVATNERYQTKEKEWKDRVEWHRCVTFGARAEGLAKFLDKGMAVFIDGSLRTSKYEKDGIDRWKTEIVARNVIVPGSRGERDEHGNNGGGDDGGDQPRRQQAQRGGSSGGGQRQAAPSGGGETAGDYVVTFGRNKDKRISEIENASDLSWLRDKLVAELADDSKSKYHDKSRKQLASIDAELARRGGGGRPAGAQRQAQRPAQAEDLGGGGDDFDDGYGGYGEGGDNDIPFLSCSFAIDPMLSYLRQFRV